MRQIQWPSTSPIKVTDISKMLWAAHPSFAPNSVMYCPLGFGRFCEYDVTTNTIRKLIKLEFAVQMAVAPSSLGGLIFFEGEGLLCPMHPITYALERLPLMPHPSDDLPLHSWFGMTLIGSNLIARRNHSVVSVELSSDLCAL